MEVIHLLLHIENCLLIIWLMMMKNNFSLKLIIKEIYKKDIHKKILSIIEYLLIIFISIIYILIYITKFYLFIF